MKIKIYALALFCSLCSLVQPALADETNSAAATELTALIAQVQAKLKDGKTTAADLAPELKDFDALLAKHAGEKTDNVAQILLMKAVLYLEVFANTEKGEELIGQLKRDFPETSPAKRADPLLASLKQQAEKKKIQSAFAVGSPFPDFSEKDLAGNPLSVAGLKGKVVLIDFWATWCGPCVAELPSLLKAYEQYHGKGFEIIGISLDQDEKKLTAFIEQKKMTWPQFFDGQGGQNKLAVKYGVDFIPATFLLDKEGKIIAKGLRGDDLAKAVAKALGGK